MGSAVSSKINVLLTGSIGGFQKSMESASASLSSFVSHAAATAGGMIAADLIEGGTKAVINSTYELVKKQLEAIDSTAKLSDSLGINTKYLSQLQYAASYSGTSVENLATGLTKMTKNLSEAQTGSGGAADALSALHLNAADLVNASPNEAIGKIADALNAVENPAQKAALAQDIFGKGAISLMPLLAEGSQGLAEFAAEADKLKWSFDRVEAAKVEMANDAMQKVDNVITSVGTRLAIELAPFIKAAADELSNMALAGDGMGKVVVDAFEWIVTAVADTTDYFSLLKGSWKFTEAAVLTGAWLVVGGINVIGKAVVDLLNLLPGVNIQWDETFSAMADNLAVQASDLADEGDKAFKDFADGANASKVKTLFDGIRSSADKAAKAVADVKQKGGKFVSQEDENAVKKISETIGNLEKQVAQFGMDKATKIAADLQSQGATPEQIAEATGLQKKLDLLEQEKKLHDDAANAAKQYYEQTRDPAEQYAAEIERINELVMQGALDQDTAQRAADQAHKKLAEAMKTDVVESPKILTAGSAEAAKFVADIQRQQTAQDASKRVFENQVKQTNLLAGIKTAIEKGSGDIQVVTFT